MPHAVSRAGRNTYIHIHADSCARICDSKHCACAFYHLPFPHQYSKVVQRSSHSYSCECTYMFVAIVSCGQVIGKTAGLTNCSTADSNVSPAFVYNHQEAVLTTISSCRACHHLQLQQLHDALFAAAVRSEGGTAR
eukprot:scaffold461762_cov25-Prasinocladus_malaysianus.AAC.1